jgi:hypothetical protein
MYTGPGNDFYDREKMIRVLEEHCLSTETFCFAPYITTDLDQDGSVLTCYRGKTRLGNWKNQPFEKSFNGEKIKSIRDDLFNGVKNRNCVSCYSAEKNGSISPRINFFNDFMSETHYNKLSDIVGVIKENHLHGDLKYIVRSEIRPSSLCNQRCMHCGPHSSTKWIEALASKDNFNLFSENKTLIENGIGPVDHKELSYQNIVNHYRGSLTSDTEYKFDILKLLDNSAEIAFTGGEPLLTPEHLEYLDYFVNVTGNSKKQILTYSSNLNIKNIERFFPYWEKFKKVEIRVSIDSSFSTYNYFRTYGDIELIKENIKKIQQLQKDCQEKNGTQFKLMASITFNMFSALRWKEILVDWSKNNLPFHASLIMDHPVSVKYLPHDLSQKAIADMQWCLDNITDFYSDKSDLEKYIHHTKNCMNYVKGFDNQFTEFPDFVIKYIDFCDKTSSNNVLDYYPELKRYLKK